MAKIVHLTSVHPRYDTRIFLKECLSLVQSGYTVFLIVADGKNTELNNGVKIIDVGRNTGGRFTRMTKIVYRIFKESIKLNGDIYHFHDPELIIVGISLKLIGKKVVYDVHENVPLDIMEKYWILPILRLPASWVMSIVEWICGILLDGIVPANPKTAPRFPDKKTITIHNYPIISDFDKMGSLQYPFRPNAFAYVGGIAKMRGAYQMVNALSIVKNKFIDVKLEIAGPYSPKSLEKDLHKLQGWQNVNYHGFLTSSEVSKLLNTVKGGLVVLHPTQCYLESYPVKMFEYMASGLPVIASDIPILREIIERENCGILVDPLDINSIADAMNWILDNPVEAEKMGRNGKESLTIRYNWILESDKLVNLYKKLLGQ